MAEPEKKKILVMEEKGRPVGDQFESYHVVKDLSDGGTVEGDSAFENIRKRSSIVSRVPRTRTEEQIKLRTARPVVPANYNQEILHAVKDRVFKDAFLKVAASSFLYNLGYTYDFSSEGSYTEKKYPEAWEDGDLFYAPVDEVKIINKSGSYVFVRFDAEADATHGHYMPDGATWIIPQRFYRYLSIYGKGTSGDKKLYISMFARERVNDDFEPSPTVEDAMNKIGYTEGS